MFRHAMFIGLLALGYLTFASANEDNNADYLKLIDAAEFAPVDPLDPECARKYGVKFEDFKSDTEGKWLTGLEDEPKFTNNWYYALCIAKKRELVNDCGKIRDKHIKNWQKETRDLGLFNDDFVDRINSTCHQRKLWSQLKLTYNIFFEDDQSEALGGFSLYVDCLLEMLKEFYEKPEKEIFEIENDKRYFSFLHSFEPSSNVDMRTKKALQRILLDTPYSIFDPSIY